MLIKSGGITDIRVHYIFYNGFNTVYYLWLIRHIKMVVVLVSTKIGKVNKLNIYTSTLNN